MLYLLDFQIEYPADRSQQELFEIWTDETNAALAAKDTGTVVDLWKCVGQRRVVAVVNVADSEELDQIMMDLPIMQKHGQLVQVEVTALRTYEGFATDIRQRG